MKTVSLKLISGYVAFLLMMLAIAFYSTYASRNSLQTSIGQNAVFVANEMLENMNIGISNWLDRFSLRSAGKPVQELADESNRQFDSLGSAEAYMSKADAEWRSDFAAQSSRNVRAVLGNAVSQDLHETYMAVNDRKGLARVVVEFLVTNKYGAVVAASGMVPQYRYDGDPLWLGAKRNGVTVGDAVWDETAQQAVLPVAIPMLDTGGKAVGMMMAKISANAIIAGAATANKKYQSTQVGLSTLDGKLVYSSENFKFLEDISATPFFKRIKGESGSFVASSEGRSVLYSFTRSMSHQNFKGMQWILILNSDVNEILAPSITLQRNITILSAILCAFGVLIGLLISRSITNPIKELKTVAMEIARGDLRRTITARGKDELGMLTRSFAEMQSALRGITAFTEKIASGDLTVQAVKRSAEDSLGISLENMLENLRNQSKEILDGAGTLAQAASEIFESTSQFATNASQTAAAVGETTMTIEAVQQGVHLSNEKAKHLADKARRTEEIAQAGRVSVEETTQVMIGRIREQMDTISASIMRLSEQSASIGEITMTVSDLADQSNLLAVNAAIEAAKAGEQGKGFAVVAQEIKSLAEQSKRATAQVRSLLTEIQKATSGAVMATEQGSKAVDQGMKQAGESKESIKSLAETVAEAALGAAQIAASSEQQRVGMDQVAMAMESIKVATMQGVDRTKQLEKEAQNLFNVGKKLKQLVEKVRM